MKRRLGSMELAELVTERIEFGEAILLQRITHLEALAGLDVTKRSPARITKQAKVGDRMNEHGQTFLCVATGEPGFKSRWRMLR